MTATVWYPYYTLIIQNNLTDLHNHVNNRIFHACKSKVTSCKKITSYKNAMPHGNSTSHLVEISWLISWKFLFTLQYLHFTRGISRVATNVHVCRNEDIVEQYHNTLCFQYSIKSSQTYYLMLCPFAYIIVSICFDYGIYILTLSQQLST